MVHRYSYVCKDFVVCYLILGLVVNAVADISLDYYFGNEEFLRSNVRSIGQCRGQKLIDSCNRKCGPTHACYLDRCFCVKINPLPEEPGMNDEDTASESMEDDDEEDYTQSASDSNSNESEDSQDEGLKIEIRPVLRHHIAHFCPNLQVARKCIRKCQKKGLPAFCGKDHHCHCGHCYDAPCLPVKVSIDEVQSAYRDLYEKYFGPKNATRQSQKIDTNTSQ